MHRFAEHLGRSTYFDQASCVHDGNAVGNLRHYRQIVRDEQHGQRKLLSQLVQQIEHLRLNGDV